MKSDTNLHTNNLLTKRIFFILAIDKINMHYHELTTNRIHCCFR